MKVKKTQTFGNKVSHPSHRIIRRIKSFLAHDCHPSPYRHKGYATDDGVALHFVTASLHKVIAQEPYKAAYHVYLSETGHVTEERIEPELLTVS